MENIGKGAFKTNPKMQKWWNEHKKHNFEVTPTFVMNTMQGIQENQMIFAKNIKSHIKAIQDVGEASKKNNEIMERVVNLLEELKK